MKNFVHDLRYNDELRLHKLDPGKHPHPGEPPLMATKKDEQRARNEVGKLFKSPGGSALWTTGTGPLSEPQLTPLALAMYKVRNA